MNENKAILGNGMCFPLAVDKLTGRIKEASYDENVKQSIKLILGTSKGERVMRPEFGCDIKKFLFESYSYGVAVQIKDVVQRALNKWEPRINQVNIEVEESSQAGAVIIKVDYFVIKTNNQFNLVFPFFLSEGIH